jgi:transcriptional regulator with XRE-family HTH domain
MAEAENIAIGKRLAAARQGAGLSIRQLAERLGWPHTTLGNYESGRRALPVARLIDIAHALGHTPAALLLDPPEAVAVVDRIAGNVELSIQVAYILETLEEPIPDDPARA